MYTVSLYTQSTKVNAASSVACVKQGCGLPKIQYAIVGTWLKHLYKKGAFTNSVDPDETPHDAVSSESALFAMLSTFLIMVDNIKSYMTSLMGAKPLTGALE